MSKGYIDKRMGGRFRDRDVNADGTGGGGLTIQQIQDLINNSSINWNQLTGSPTTNTELKNYIDSLLELIALNQFNANEQITQEMKDYFDTLLSHLTITSSQITDLDSINQAFKTYIDNQLSELTSYINQLILGNTYTDALKQYIDNAIANLKTSLEQLIANTVNTEIQNYIDQITNINGEATRLISGTITWIQNLDFQVSPLVYQILNRRAESAERLLTLPPSLNVNPVFAVIYGDIFGNIGWVFGIPSPAPAIPRVADSTQIALLTVYIPALGTSPAPDPNGETHIIETEVIYDENIEWATANTAQLGIDVNLVATNEPAIGTKHISLIFTGATGTMERGELISAPAKSEGLAYRVDADIPAEGTIDFLTADLFPDHNTDYIKDGIRHLVYYKALSRTAIGFNLISKDNGSSSRLRVSNMTTGMMSVPNLSFYAEISSVLTLQAHLNGVTAGNYSMEVSGFKRYDQQYQESIAANKIADATSISFTRAAAINADKGTISLSLKTTAPWLSTTGLLFEFYDATKNVGIISMLPGNMLGFNPANTNDYQRITLPISVSQLKTLVIRPVNAWGNGALYIDNVILQTGVQSIKETDKYVKFVGFNTETRILTIRRSCDLEDITVTIPETAQLQPDFTQADNQAKDYIKNKPTLGTIASKDFWTGTAAAYAAIGAKDANTIYHIEE